MFTSMYLTGLPCGPDPLTDDGRVQQVQAVGGGGSKRRDLKLLARTDRRPQDLWRLLHVGGQLELLSSLFVQGQFISLLEHYSCLVNVSLNKVRDCVRVWVRFAYFTTMLTEFLAAKSDRCFFSKFMRKSLLLETALCHSFQESFLLGITRFVQIE